jgi:hypothetical protein
MKIILLRLGIKKVILLEKLKVNYKNINSNMKKKNK